MKMITGRTFTARVAASTAFGIMLALTINAQSTATQMESSTAPFMGGFISTNMGGGEGVGAATNDAAGGARAGAGAGGGRRGGGGGGGGGRGGAALRGAYKGSLTAHWFADSTKFWYRNDLRGNTKEFILVDAGKGTRGMAFDHAKLAMSLSKAAGATYKADTLPFSDIEFVDGDKAVKFTADGKTWKCDLNSYACTEQKDAAAIINRPMQSEVAAVEENSDDSNFSNRVLERDEFVSGAPYYEPEPGGGRAGGGGGRAGAGGAGRAGAGGGRGGGGRGGGFNAGPATSPDGKWTALIKEQNVYLRSEPGGEETQLTTDGATNNYYGMLRWAGDSKAFAAWRVEPGNSAEVYRLQSSPAQPAGRAILQSQMYPQAGDTFNRYELSLFNVETKKQTKPQVDRTDYRAPNLRPSTDNYHLVYEKEDRGHQRWRLIELDTHTGAIRNIVDEKTDTFIWTDNREGLLGMQRLSYLSNTPELIYESEQTGWRHFYLVDLKAGGKSGLTPITKGEWCVRALDQIDEEKRQIWFRASGIFPNQNPFYMHYCRVNFDGSGFVVMTEGDGEHSVAYSPDKKYLVDTYSQLDKPRQHELRRVSDGKLVCKLESEDISEAKERGWVPPLELFVAKGRDGKTDIYGYIERPTNIDTSKKYPIVEDIYAGPQGSPGTMVPTTFATAGRHQQYTPAGIIAVKIDGMGMPGRSKAFHDVAWRNLGDAGFPDRIAWMKAAAKKYPYMDIDRVGIYGTSAGGQNAGGAVLFHPEFYKVAVANCGCHDNRIDKSSWNEQWMGYCPPDKIWTKDADNWYSQSSNIDNAYRLKGWLFLIVGELDNNVPPESTLRYVNELIRTGKQFEFLEVPGAGHGAGQGSSNPGYAGQRTRDFLIKHLMQPEPLPNGAVSTGATSQGN